VATEKAHDGGPGRSWGRKTASERLGGVDSVPGSALGSQGDGEGVGELESARGVACRVYWTVELHWVLSVAEVRELKVGRASAQEVEA